MSSSLLLSPQRFGRYVLRPLGVCRTREPTWNFELRPLSNPRGVACSDSVSHNRVQVLSKYCRIVTRLQSGLNLQPPDDCLLRSLGNQRLQPLHYVSSNAYNRYAMCPAMPIIVTLCVQQCQ